MHKNVFISKYFITKTDVSIFFSYFFLVSKIYVSFREAREESGDFMNSQSSETRIHNDIDLDIIQQPRSVTELLNRNLANMSKDQILIIKELCNSDSLDQRDTSLPDIQESPPTSTASRRILKPSEIPNLKLFTDAMPKQQIDSPFSNASSYDNDKIMHIDESSLSEMSQINQKLTDDLEFNTSLANSKAEEYDDSMFHSDVGTPVLYQPEIFNICGSSTSLLVSRRAERFSTSSGQAESAESARSKEYRSIHKMFANKSKCESDKE